LSQDVKEFAGKIRKEGENWRGGELVRGSGIETSK
jgi:hypothetical protein